MVKGVVWESVDRTCVSVHVQTIFEEVNKAYEFLCSKSAKRSEGPDPHRIVLLLQTQSILFKRYADGEWIT